MRIKTRHLFGRLPLAVDTRQGVASFFFGKQCTHNALTIYSLNHFTALFFLYFIFGYFWLGLNFEL